MDEAEDVFREYIQSKGLKFTPERKAILNYVFENHGHFEVEELLFEMRKNKVRVSKATIYRTVALLVKCGLLREVIFGEKHTHYEHVYGHEHHEHLVCSGCGKIIEFSDERIEKFQDEICVKNMFKPESHRFQITGYCEECVGGKSK
ncbi:MAG: transcriptional repressor [Candidatus Scalindua sp. AMX11]|nr:MAG: transcriptional repressor [Candidatus Scalindua sp.]NOG82261.1 transcriptional repressor [Planctomycetota bacterium]RZV71448.1 MAG: transcriptional repressor [Candidatus Scalindua sp. SCAELEC01]TDE64288.1 MAG: transcriptional repressor [Candidatus Scalindua sp. AMX11]GJQ59928.1 MAG: transcriptional repressor [Candidatus Scalindua sp.]